MPWQPPRQDKCQRCDKTVYAAEKMEAGKLFWHKQCFRCAACDIKLTLNNYCQDRGFLLCKTHFQEHVMSQNAQITT